MEGVTIVADVPSDIERHAFPAAAAPSISVMSYNISFNLSSILAKLPGSRFLALLRKGVHEYPIDTFHPVASVVEEWTTETSPDVDTPPVAAAADELISVPGPWAFFASGYMLGLLLLTIVLHRMRNVIIPSRIPAPRTRHAFFFSPTLITPFHYTHISQRLFSSILPLNFSRTTTRLAFHLPSIYFLSKMLLIWCLLVMQTCQLLPSFNDAQKSASWGILGHVERLCVWTSQKEMAEICWATFCAVCAALFVEGFMKALDGIGSALPIGNVNTSPFSLIGYAFLLHAYSFPIAHSQESTNEGPSRPDKHAIITVAIPLLQLTIFHILSVSKRYSRHRLIPTALTSFLSLSHFHATIFHHFFGSSVPAPTLANPTISLSRLKLSPYLGGSRFTYPLLNYVPNIFETILIGSIMLTTSLNALVQLLVNGRVDHIFSGLGVTNWRDEGDEATTLSFFRQLPYEEDFGIFLLRIGTASLEATGLRGWNNEVAPIPLPTKSGNQPRARGSFSRGNHLLTQTHGVVRMGRIGVVSVQYGTSAYASTSRSRAESISNSSNPYEDLSIRRRRRSTKSVEIQQRPRRGLFNEVRTVELNVTNKSGPPHGIAGRLRRIKQICVFFVALWDVLKGLVLFLWDKLRSRGRSQQGRVKKPSTVIRTSAEGEEEDHQSVEDDDEFGDDTLRMDREKEVYSRFLRGEEISDDEYDDDFTSSFEDDDSHRDEEEEEEEGETEENRQGEVVQLFSDFLRNEPGTSTASVDGEMVLAHLLQNQTTSSGPLTRRGWRELVQKTGVGGARDYRSHFRDNADDDDTWDQISFNGNRLTPTDSQQLSSTTACVVCTNGQRNIICWPCRCLAMCDNCREALASRSAPPKHCCPCCRQTVDGYSRIYIP